MMPGSDGRANPSGKWEVPAAFYRDDTPPLPPPGDPHRMEFYAEPGVAGRPDWLLVSIGSLALLVAVLLAIALAATFLVVL